MTHSIDGVPNQTSLAAQARADRVLLVSEPPREGQGAWATALVRLFDACLHAYLAQRRPGVKA